MSGRTLNVAILGSTGSIGRSTLDVIGQAANGTLRIYALAAGTSCQALLEQARTHRPRYVALADAAAARRVEEGLRGMDVEVLSGPEGIERLAVDPQVDRVVSAIVGAAGLRGTWAALEAGKTVALANKETLVVAGPLVTALAARTGAKLLPVDSEHSAIFQAMQAGGPKEVRRVVLTSSGGPFRGKTTRDLARVTPAEALKHPTWSMGPKITIDSATLMNKALEVIEAHWLFGLPPEKIEVVVHPESVAHSFVEYVDGSVMAQLSPPDMRLPIQYALTYPERVDGPARRVDWNEAFSLRFEPPDRETFPALELGYEVIRRGGTAGAALNAANEAAVARFLDGSLGFLDIARACRAAIEEHPYDPSPTLPILWEVDAWARQEVGRWRT